MTTGQCGDAPLLSDNAVDVHLAFWNDLIPCLPEYYQWLSGDEKEKAARFHRVSDHNQFIIGRGLLRKLLGHYAGIPPQRLQFNYNPFGKPFLAKPLNANGIHFNLSHSHRVLVCAITKKGEIGIDVEYMRPIAGLNHVARHFFSGYENRVFELLPLPEQLGAFYACWTRKEAFVKLKGQGLAIPLKSFTVSLLPGEPPELLALPNGEDPARYFMYEVNLLENYKIVLCAEGPVETICPFVG
ncbi:MAG: 4'-phosphopantetheinyl transferase superfamily protein [Ferruginibacter sp.]|nr:4'-phosphopantetheinyl transferase superfamily protein [Cytophagales bacterium]